MFELKPNRIVLSRSKTGLFCAEESGGGNTNTGRATIICSPSGNAPVPLYIPKKGDLCNGVHAVIPVGYHNYIIDATHHRGDFQIVVRKIYSLEERIFPSEEIPSNVRCHEVSPGMSSVMWADTYVVHTFDNGEWDVNPLEYLSAAIDAAMGKAQDYHCREPWYVATIEVGSPLSDLATFPQLHEGEL